jgi:hypothetical protein
MKATSALEPTSGDHVHLLLGETPELVEIANVSRNVSRKVPPHGFPPHAASAVSVFQNGFPGSNSSRSFR